MDDFTFEVTGMDELHQKFAHSREEMLISMNQGLREMGQLLTPRLKDATPTGASNKLRNTTVFQVLGSAEDMRLEVRQMARSEKGYLYGPAVRYGTRPHFPPIEALIPWVRVKLMGMSRAKVKKTTPEKEARSIAFLIARRISRVGTKANPYHVRVFEASKGEVVAIAQKFVFNFVAKFT
jgi:hypothetical protein